jgi:predicted amidophosphoribosyltransferase
MSETRFRVRMVIEERMFRGSVFEVRVACQKCQGRVLVSHPFCPWCGAEFDGVDRRVEKL